jgi:hypothetical protein
LEAGVPGVDDPYGLQDRFFLSWRPTRCELGCGGFEHERERFDVVGGALDDVVVWVASPEAADVGC